MENCRERRSLFIATITPKTTRWFKAMTLRFLGWESGLFSKTKETISFYFVSTKSGHPKEKCDIFFSSLSKNSLRLFNKISLYRREFKNSKPYMGFLNFSLTLGLKSENPYMARDFRIFFPLLEQNSKSPYGKGFPNIPK